jgi:hypothetical protein
MRALQFHPIETALAGIGGYPRIALNNLQNILVFDRFRHFAEQRIGERRRRPGRQAGEHAAALAAVVVDLGQNRHAFGVNRAGDAFVMRDDPAMKGMNQLFVRMIGGMRGVFFGDDQPGSAPRPFPVVMNVMPLAGQEIFGVIGQMRREHDPVLDRDAADLQGVNSNRGRVLMA